MSTKPSAPPSPADLAFTQGVIDAFYGAMRGVATGDPSASKLYHRYELGSASELAWHQGCQFAAERLIQGAITQNELRSKK